MTQLANHTLVQLSRRVGCPQVTDSEMSSPEFPLPEWSRLTPPMELSVYAPNVQAPWDHAFVLLGAALCPAIPRANLRAATQFCGSDLRFWALRRRRSRWASLKAAATTSAGSSKTWPSASIVAGGGRRVQRPTSQE